MNTLMDVLSVLVAKVRGLVVRPDVDRDLEEEFAHHIEMETRRLTATGVSEAEARRQALTAFGGIDRHKEEMRDGRTPRWIPDTMQDVRYALRTMARMPLYAVVVCLTLACGVALNSALFAVFDGYMFRGLPFKDTDRIVVLGSVTPSIQLPHEIDVRDYLDLHRDGSVFAKLSGYVMDSGSLSTEESAERVSMIYATSEYFDVYNARPIMGRSFEPADEVAGAPPIVLLSFDAWNAIFHGDPAVVGKSAKLNGRPVTVAGVLPARFDATNPLLQVDAYIPLRGLESAYPQRGGMSLNVIGRLKPGATLAQASSLLETFGRRMATAYPASNTNVRFLAVAESHARPVLAIAAPMRRAGYAFLALALLVLVIASVNVTNMTLARAITREREFAVRASLGASRSRVIRQLVVEMGTLSVIGSALGLVLATFALRALSSVQLATDIPLKLNFMPTSRVYAFTAFITAITMVLTALVPAMQAGGVRMHDALSAGRGGVGEPRRRLRATLVFAQIAASVVVLSTAALFYRSAVNAQGTALGFRTDHVLMATTDAETIDFTQQQSDRFYRALRARVEALPGVRGVAFAQRVPFGYNNSLLDLVIEGGENTASKERPSVFYNPVSAGYFEAMGIARTGGRGFSAGDTSGAPRVAIITEAMAAKYWPPSTALGRRFRSGEDTVAYTVVGIVSNSKYFTMGEAPREFVYLPIEQTAPLTRTLHVWTSTDPSILTAPIRAIVHELEPSMPLFDVRTMQQHLQYGRALYFMRLGAIITGALGVLALFLCTVGLYGVVAYGVSRRTRELGVRIAFGAGRRDVLQLVVGKSLMITAGGLAAGLACAFGVAKLMQPLLVGVATVPALGGAALILTAVTLLATLIPATRAMRVQPTTALRAD